MVWRGANGSCVAPPLPNMSVMTHVSRPLVALLVGTVLFFALWMVALKPSSSSSGGAPTGVGRYQSAVNQAKNSVKAQNQQSANAGTIPGTATPTPATTTPAATPATTTPAATPSTPTQPAAHAPAKHHSAAAAHKHHAVAAHKAPKHSIPAVLAPAVHVHGARHRFSVVTTALREHKVLAVLFYNPAGSDDQAVKREIKSIPTYKGRVVKLTVPISELSRYTSITTQVMVSTTPTLVLIDRHSQASLITGYAAGFEIATEVASAVGK
jgi:hypothetical protein